MTDKALDDLRVIAARLAPGIWVSLDEVAIERCFGYGPAARQAADAFAKEYHCTLIRDKSTMKLSKAYPELGRR